MVVGICKVICTSTAVAIVIDIPDTTLRNRTKTAHTSIVISVWALKTSGNAAESLTEHHQLIWMCISVAPLDEGAKEIAAPKRLKSASTQKIRRRLVNYSFRVLGTRKCRNLTSSGNDRFEELDGDTWFTAKDASRCSANVNSDL